jgi:uncharacterized membrane protein
MEETLIMGYRHNTSAITNNSAHQVTERRLHYFLLFIYLVVVFRLWIMPLGTSFWIDETVTYWNVMKGTSEVLRRSAACAGQFQLYMFITALSAKFFGLNEIGLRLPSIVASIGSSWLMFRIGQRFSDTETGIFAAIFFVCFPEISIYATSARSYSLVILFSLLAVWQLIKLHDTGEWRHVAGYTVAAALMIYMHYITAPFLIVLLLYSVLQHNKSDITTKHRAIIAHTLLFIIITPLIFIILDSGKDTPSLSTSGTPNIYHFIRAIINDYVLFVFFSVLACKIFLKIKTCDFYYFYKKYDLFITIWLLIPIASLYMISVFTEYKVFLYRYYIISYPALILFLAAALQKIRHNMFRYIVLSSSCIIAISSSGGMNAIPMEDWRGALTTVKAMAEATKIPLLFNSGLVETLQPGWELQSANHQLLSPLSAYPINTRVVALPAALNEKSRPYLETHIAKEITSVKKFIVVLRIESNSGAVDRWIQEYARPHGFTRREVGNFRGVLVVFYEQKKLT